MKLQDFDFRIWDKHHNGCGNKDCKCQTKYVYGEEAKTRLSEFKEDCEIELFTGLYDKNENKIYEGDIIIFDDIVHDTNRIGRIIKRHIDEFRVEFNKDDTLGLIILNESDLLVIGNIHENKELLEGE